MTDYSMVKYNLILAGVGGFDPPLKTYFGKKEEIQNKFSFQVSASGALSHHPLTDKLVRITSIAKILRTHSFVQSTIPNLL
jgi:hypothetical protein